VKIPLFNTLLKGPEATNESPRIGEFEGGILRIVVNETDASVLAGASAVARHSANPQLPFIQQGVANQAIKYTPRAINAPDTAQAQDKLDTAFEFLGFPTESIATVPQQTPVATAETSTHQAKSDTDTNVIDLDVVRQRVAEQFSSKPGEVDGIQTAA
jgi:hypothetical protein